MFTETAYEAFMKLKQVRRRSWGGGATIYIYIYSSYVGFQGTNRGWSLSWRGVISGECRDTSALRMHFWSSGLGVPAWKHVLLHTF